MDVLEDDIDDVAACAALADDIIVDAAPVVPWLTLATLAALGVLAN